MKRITSFLIIVLFVVWILPLGTYIKPEQEEEACNGQRAICLCTKLLLKKMAKIPNQTFLAPGATTILQFSSSPSLASQFVNEDFIRLVILQNSREIFYEEKKVKHTLYIPSIEHVPKQNLFI